MLDNYKRYNIHEMGLLGEERKEQNIWNNCDGEFHQIIVIQQTKPQTQKTQRTPSRMNAKQNKTLRLGISFSDLQKIKDFF